MLDAGNALFKTSAPGDDPSLRRAELILRAMGEMGTAAMAVGDRDLVAGPEFLKRTAARAKLRLLSANLVDGSGRLLFEPSWQVSVGGARVGVLGISPAQEGAGNRRRPPVEAALLEARKLKGKVDLIIALAAVPYADALQLSKEAGDSIDLILQSHEGRGVGMAQRNGSTYLLPTGERGRQLGHLELDLSGSGPLVDLGKRERDQQLIKLLDRQIAEARTRLEAVDAGANSSISQTMRSFQARRDSLEKESSGLSEKNGRAMKLDFLTLGTDFRDDPSLKDRVVALEPVPPDH